jgi:PilZ domain-containing protein
MSGERREFARTPDRFDAVWTDASGQHPCHVTGLNPGGCFVDDAQSPEPDASVSVTIRFDGRHFTVPGEVVYRDAVQGFGVRFLASDQRRALAYAMGMPDTARG